MAKTVTKAITPKKRCCKDRPRCKRCPVVLRRLEAQGLAKRTPSGGYVVDSAVRKKAMRVARSKSGKE